MKGFKKGQRVTLIRDWDQNGSFHFVDAVVHSCGKKQMVLTNEGTGEELGRHFLPYDASNVMNRPAEAFGRLNDEFTFPRMTEEEATEFCLRAGHWKVEQEKARYAMLKARNASDAGYCKAIDRSVAELHEPRAVRR